jgi:gamma-glutamyltranspeptidase/glutathione hydrolase
MAKARGAVACGHERTAEAARIALEAGGNAFDALIAAAWAACVAEPVLVSPGGGGFLLARPCDGPVRVFDFFTQTPRRRSPVAQTDFFPIVADFGGVTQEFHIGLGSIATPGLIRGLFRIHRDLAGLPMRELVESACTWARQGVRVNAFQAYIFRVIQAIYLHSPDSRAIFGSPGQPGSLVGEGETLRQPELADAIEILAVEGDDLFYRGEMGRRLVLDCTAAGGHLSSADLEGYRVELRHPLQAEYRDARLWLNPPPSSGGILIAFSLGLLHGRGGLSGPWGDPGDLADLARVMELTNRARQQAYDSRAHEPDVTDTFLDPQHLSTYLRALAPVQGRPDRLGSTTQISVMDGAGNVAAFTASNGEGSGCILPGTGIMLNNMLGEEDVNPHGFHRWREDTRISSMMAPTVVERGSTLICTGSGGSNRIRTAILQVLVKLLDLELDLEAAVNGPRIHMENGLLSVEGGFDADTRAALRSAFPRIDVWEQRNLFFGGAHTVTYDTATGRFAGVGDMRRGGVALVL